MKYSLLFILFSLFIASCSQYQANDGVVEIVGFSEGIPVIRGMGVCITPDVVLTSAHVVRDDRISYELHNTIYEGDSIKTLVLERDTGNDIAYMKMKSEEGRVNNICNEYKKYIGKSNVGVGQDISVPVMRSGSILILTGTVTSLTGTLLAYDTLGRTELMTGVLMTNIEHIPGDSGAPILDEQGRVIDVVHIK